MDPSESECAREVVEVAPLIVAAIRGEMRRSRRSDLTVPQFRTLIFVSRHRGTSLSAVASHIGLTLPSMSKLVDGLVSSGLARRTADPEDRRRIALSLTGRGSAALRRARTAAQDSIAGRLAVLSREERASISKAMRVLRALFSSDDRPSHGGRGDTA